MCPNSIRKVVDHVTDWTSHVKDFSYLDWSGVRLRNYSGPEATWRILSATSLGGWSMDRPCLSFASYIVRN
jgi:hypothetical protein